ncbi:Sexual development regulator velC [Fusarium duplospermum]|uniref:Sexual development regulator velC n=1 Tax=Fusarium duplospermum TaxID=1325734 RepID=A0A428NIL8_9HYPO|nr:Sexual development regulator velC [Fusarium duplospermum]
MSQHRHISHLLHLNPRGHGAFTTILCCTSPGLCLHRRDSQRCFAKPGILRILANGSRAGAAPSVDLQPDLRRTSRLWAPAQASRSGDIGVAGSRGPAARAKYVLSIRQQPVAARSCGSGERDRRAIDPPPILQLRIEGPGLAEEESSKLLRYSDYVMSCSIYDQSGTRDLSFMPEEYRQRRRLMGSVVGTSFVGQDEYGETGCFFCFPDLSCRTPGSFRLKFSLVEIDLAQARQTKHFPILAETMSDIFAVYLAKDFPGMQASTPLVKHLKEQGCVITIKKGFRESNSDSDQDDSGNEEREVEWSPTRKRRRLGNGRAG